MRGQYDYQNEDEIQVYTKQTHLVELLGNKEADEEECLMMWI
jgi:hypothetical protein